MATTIARTFACADCGADCHDEVPTGNVRWADNDPAGHYWHDEKGWCVLNYIESLGLTFQIRMGNVPTDTLTGPFCKSCFDKQTAH